MYYLERENCKQREICYLSWDEGVVEHTQFEPPSIYEIT